jgi:plasmid maintenance system killer protein
MLNIPNHYRNANLNYNEISHCTFQNGFYQKQKRLQMLQCKSGLSPIFYLPSLYFWIFYGKIYLFYSIRVNIYLGNFSDKKSGISIKLML